MPKTIAITPSWYWPEQVDRVAGIPPFAVQELCLTRHARRDPDSVALIDGAQTFTWQELQQRAQGAARLVRGQAGAANGVVIGCDPTADNLALLLGALSAGVAVRIAAVDDAGEVLTLTDAGVSGAEDSAPTVTSESLRAAAVTIPAAGGDVEHSHRSLLAMVISLTTFLAPLPQAPWLTTLGLDRWDGLTAALIPLFCGQPLILAGTGDADATLAQVADHRPGYAFFDLDAATEITRASRRGVRKARDVLTGILLCTRGMFDPGDRQRVGKSFRCPALTLFGVAQTGPIFASHPQWYIEESVGIPITNAHVVPSDPRNGIPIQALWEQVESAEVTVKGPMLMCRGEDGANQPAFVDGRYRTGVIASSDANGMIYLLPD